MDICNSSINKRMTASNKLSFTVNLLNLYSLRFLKFSKSSHMRHGSIDDRVSLSMFIYKTKHYSSRSCGNKESCALNLRLRSLYELNLVFLLRAPLSCVFMDFVFLRV